MKKLSVLALFASFLLLIPALLSAAPAKKKMTKADGYINSFEVPPSEMAIGDFYWETNGYVELLQFKKHASRGKFSCQARFSVPTDFVSEAEAASLDSWIAPMTMSINTLTKLKHTDWSLFKKFGVDVYNPETVERTLYIKITDSAGKEYTVSRPVKQGKNKLEFLLAEADQARLDLKNIVSYTLYLNTKNEPKDIYLYIDNTRLVP